MFVLLTESDMNKELISIIENQNSHYLTIIGLVVSLSLAVFGIIQWQINDKKLQQLKITTLRDITKEYDLDDLKGLKDMVESLRQNQDKIFLKIRTKDIEWLNSIRSSIELDINKLAANKIELSMQKEIMHNIFIKLNTIIYKDFLYEEDKEETIYAIYSIIKSFKDDTSTLKTTYANICENPEIMKVVKKKE